MKKMKMSLAALVLIATVGTTLTVNAGTKSQVTMCSSEPGGQGVIGPLQEFGCTGGSFICCFRMPDNFIYYKAKNGDD